MIENICTSDSLDDMSVLINLKKRSEKKIIYTYASDVLIAINPYESLPQLYESSQVTRYLADENVQQKPPHIYAIANEALKTLKMFKKSQSMMITGVSGSGKTESAKHIINFLCQSDLQNIAATDPIFEAFGNAKTRANENSSRFCKYMELLFDDNVKGFGARISYYLLETNRIVANLNTNESNFHIFYILLGAEAAFLKKIHIDLNTSYRYIPDVHGTSWQSNFSLVDNSLSTLGFTDWNKTAIYMNLSAILNLGNIAFESMNNDDACAITIESRKHLCYAATLLNISELVLEDALTCRTRIVNNQQIKSPLIMVVAEKARDSLAKSLYEKLFDQIILQINAHLSTSSSNNSIGILDIAGFEYIKEANNTFDQLCINYCNERFHNVFLQLKLLEEKQWYDSQRLDIPFVEFFDNTHILDLFHNKPKGLFTILNDECTLQRPSTVNFGCLLKNAWQKDGNAPISWNIRGQKSNENIFLIRHFTNDVIYSMEDFVEKNQKVLPDILHMILQQSTFFDKSNIKSQSFGKLKTYASTLKFEIEHLIGNLKKTDLHFIRCISPNNEKRNDKFNEDFVLQQLNTSGTISYARFIQYGYSKHISLQKINDVLKSKMSKTCADQSDFYSKVLLAIGFKITDFKIGQDAIFFRSNKFYLLEKVFSDASSFKGQDNQALTLNQIRIPKSLSENPVERIEGLIWKSRLKIFLSALKFLLRWKKIKYPNHSQKLKTTFIQYIDLNIGGDRDYTIKHIVDSEIMNEIGDKPTKQKCIKRSLPLQENIAVNKRNRTEKRPDPSLRFDQNGHFPIIDKTRLARCKKEGCKNGKSYVICSKCDIHLCLNITENRNCFTEFHHLK